MKNNPIKGNRSLSFEFFEFLSFELDFVNCWVFGSFEPWVLRVLEHWEAWELWFDDWGMFRYDFGGFGVLKTRLGMAQGWGPRLFLRAAALVRRSRCQEIGLAGRRGPWWRAPRPLPQRTLGAAAQGVRAAALALFSPRLLVLTPGT